MSPDDVVVPLAVSSVEAALYRLLEVELARVAVLRAGDRCVADGPRSGCFEAPLEEAELHVAIAHSILDSFGLDPEADVVERLPLRTLGRGLVDVMEQALALLDEPLARLTIAECVGAVALSRARCWVDVTRLAELTQGEPGEVLRAAVREVAPWRVLAARGEPGLRGLRRRGSILRDYALRSGVARVAPARPRPAGGARHPHLRLAPRGS